MDANLLASFEAASSSSNDALILSLLATVAGLAGMLAMLLRKPAPGQRNQNLMLAMLLFFVFLIGASTAFFSWMRQAKLGPVEIYADRVETPYGVAPYSRIRNAEIIADQQQSPFSTLSREGTRILAIMEYDGKTHALSEEDYPIGEVMARLREAVKAYREQEEKKQ